MVIMGVGNPLIATGEAPREAEVRPDIAGPAILSDQASGCLSSAATNSASVIKTTPLQVAVQTMPNYTTHVCS
jgi:hypothetical protein